ncbi:MAG: hypothetical protein IIC50_18190 [Planctomycetes bacterium]|nr:hypothetical protein [Planctomycetota bacterium]
MAVTNPEVQGQTPEPLVCRVVMAVGIVVALLPCLNRSGAVWSAFSSLSVLHPQNSHYFLWWGEPTTLITSAEHYGAVLKPDFNYRTYLATSAAEHGPEAYGPGK